ncbi:transposase InsO family protein [Paraburkholderia youngii]
MPLVGRLASDAVGGAHRRAWPNLQAVEMSTLEWVDWFNHRRLLEPIGNIPPAEAEARYYQQLAGLCMAA